MHEESQVTDPPAASAASERSTPGVHTVSSGPVAGAPSDVTQHQLAVALTWVRRGIPVVPCSRTDKGPMVAGFGKDATAEQLAPFYDSEQVEAWWRGRFKRAHVGLLTRALVVVDLDMRKPGTEIRGQFADVQGGTDVLEVLMREAGADWPDTYTVLTPSGGMHLYFVQPDGEPIGCATGDGPAAPHLGPLIDVRGVGGLVIGAGSYSAAQGRPYTRISPPELRPQPLPAWLLERLRPAAPAAAPRPPSVRQIPTGDRAERAAAAALNSATEKVVNAPEGERNRRLFSAARWLGELHETAPAVLGETAVSDQLLAAARSGGVAEREALRTIRSGWERGLRDGAGHRAGAA